MAAGKKRLEELLDAAAARGATLAMEQMQGQFRAFGESLGGLREQMTRGFDETRGEMNRRFEQVDRRLDTIDGRLDTIDGRLDQVDGRLDQVDGRLDQMDRRFDRIDLELAQVKDAVMVHQRQLRDLRAAVDKKVDRDEVESLVERAVARAVGH